MKERKCVEEIRICPIHAETTFVKCSNDSWRCRRCRLEKRKYKRDIIKKLCVDYKGGECSMCGYKKNLSALEFHHINPNDKDFEITSISTTDFSILKKELDKCICVCANCHREIHNS